MSPRSLPKRLDGVSGVVSKVSALYLLETHSEIITTGFLMQKEKKNCASIGTQKIMFIPMGLRQ